MWGGVHGCPHVCMCVYDMQACGDVCICKHACVSTCVYTLALATAPSESVCTYAECPPHSHLNICSLPQGRGSRRWEVRCSISQLMI